MTSIKNQPSYLKAIVIVHGKSELQINNFIKQSLRLKIESYSEHNGENSIQIDGLNKILDNSIFRSIDKLYKKYPDLNVVGKGRKKRIENFRLFIIMDTDDCKKNDKESFKNKEMFKGHWAYDYIVPIFNDKNLEEVLQSCGIVYEKVSPKKLKSEYIKIFPTHKKYTQKTDKLQIDEFNNKLKSSKKTNRYEFIDYCIEVSKDNIYLNKR